MAAQTQGTAHLWGVDGTITNLTIMSVRERHEPMVKASTANESGLEIERRYDDVHDTVTITARMKTGYTVPSAKGSVLSWNSVDYEVQSIEVSQENQRHQELTIEAKKSESITPA